MQIIVKLIENIALVAAGVAGGFIGAHEWGILSPLTVFLCAVSLIFILRGATGLMEIVKLKD